MVNENFIRCVRLKFDIPEVIFVRSKKCLKNLCMNSYQF